MNNPFDYEPSPLMLGEQKRLAERINQMREASSSFREEVDKGKMFGILITKECVLYAFSGQICGKADAEGFVPAVYDYLQEDGYFKTHEREISGINAAIAELEASDHYNELKHELSALLAESVKSVEEYKEKMRAAKAERDLVRGKGLVSDAELIRESQFMKAQLHRIKLKWKSELEQRRQEFDAIEGGIRALKLQRQRKSDALQRWLFEQFRFESFSGERKNLLEIFGRYAEENHIKGAAAIPPSGSGECCEPKLLHYAVAHKLHPMEMGMFWWGESPRQEIRHHLHFYPACNGKCKPILQFLLSDMTLGKDASGTVDCLREVFVDDHLIVVSKPSGMLSVPGKGVQPSVYSLLKEKYGEVFMVHRLDMDTSGLLVVARTREVHKSLQRQFAEHTIGKTYIAELERPVMGEGRISLPLCPDVMDRPRQVVSREHGKKAETVYKALGGTRIELQPLTGRTHQLRVHCAHAEGLDNPIKGDRLYGHKADRLYLHASVLEFTHPITMEWVTFRDTSFTSSLSSAECR